MIVITHTIKLADLQLTQNFAALPIDDGIERWEISLPIRRDDFLEGASLTDSLMPITWCDTGRNLHWYNIKTSPLSLDMDLWNQDTIETVPFDDFLPYMDMVV